MDVQKSIQSVGRAITVAEQAIRTDNLYWETLAIGQTTEEAESSGYLEGYRDALSAVHTLFGYGDESTLQGYLDAMKDIMADQREEIEEIETDRNGS